MLCSSTAVAARCCEPEADLNAIIDESMVCPEELKDSADGG